MSGPKSCKQSVCRKTTDCFTTVVRGDDGAGVLGFVSACATTRAQVIAHRLVMTIVRLSRERHMPQIILLPCSIAAVTHQLNVDTARVVFTGHAQAMQPRPAQGKIYKQAAKGPARLHSNHAAKAR